MNLKFHRQLARVFSPESAVIATRALNSALCCFLFTPTSYAPLDRSAFSSSRCPKNRSRRTNGRPIPVGDLEIITELIGFCFLIVGL